MSDPSPDSGPGPGSESAGPPAPSPRRAGSRWAKPLIAVLCAALGFALVVQVRQISSGDSLSTARPDDLVEILDGLQRREDELTKEVTELQDTLARLRRTGAGSAEALAEANRQAQALGILAGTVPATGPGAKIVIDDPRGQIPPEVLLDALEELRNAGAEAFQVGPVRIGVDSAFSGGPGAVTLDGRALSRPYVIQAIGDPPTLAAALAIPGGVLDTVRRAGGTLRASQLPAVRIDALRPSRTPLYARPTGG